MKEDLTEKERNCQLVYVRQEDSGTVTCPHCETSYRVNAGEMKTRGRDLKVRCKCSHIFEVFFEYRKNPRRELSVRGHYRRIEEGHVRDSCRTIPESEGLNNMLVKDISRNGIGFVVPTGHNLDVGDRVEVMFTLDDAQSTRMERSAIVQRVAEGNYLGCEFTDVGYIETDTGFFVTKGDFCMSVVSKKTRDELLDWITKTSRQKACGHFFKIITEDAATWLNKNWCDLSQYSEDPNFSTDDGGVRWPGSVPGRELKPLESGSIMYLQGEDIITIIGSLVQYGKFKPGKDFKLRLMR
jgi:predicted Zn finger-like uncharacterized protein